MKNLTLNNTSYNYLEKSFGEWLDILGYAPSTVYSLPIHVREFLHHLNEQGIIQITKLEPKDIREYYELLKIRSNTRSPGALSSAYINKHLQAITRFLDYLRQQGRITIATPDIRWQQTDRSSISILSTEEIQQLYKITDYINTAKKIGVKKIELQEAINSRDKAMLTVFYGCGLRRNEGAQMNLEDINLDTKTLHVKKGKNYKERIVPFNKQSANYFEQYIYEHRSILLKSNTESAFFISERGSRLSGQMMALKLGILQNRSEDPNIKEKRVTLHNLRHSIATHLLDAGMSLENISRFLGHSSLESTQIYTHLTKTL